MVDRVKISKAALTDVGGWTVNNSRNPNTAFTPILSSSLWPAALLSDLSAEDTELGYPEAYVTKSAALRNRKTRVWQSPNGMCIGKPLAFLGLTRVETNAHLWMTNLEFVRRQVMAMGLPTIRARAFQLDFGTAGCYAKPGMMIANLSDDIVQRMAMILLGRNVTPDQVDFAQFCADQSNGVTWHGGAASSKAVANAQAGPLGTFTFYLYSLWGGHCFRIRFKNLGYEPLITSFGLEYSTLQWYGDQEWYNYPEKCKDRSVWSRLLPSWTSTMRRAMWDYCNSYATIGPDASNTTMGWTRAQSTWLASTPGWTIGDYWNTGQPYNGGLVQIYQDETVSVGDWQQFGSLHVGDFYVCGVQPFFSSMGCAGPTTRDQFTKTIDIDQRRFVAEWNGPSLVHLKPDLTQTQKDALSDLQCLSVFNLEGSWWTPANPLHNLGMWEDAQEADMDLNAEVFAEASDDNPVITFGQANTRASLQQVGVLHKLTKLRDVDQDIVKLQISGSVGAFTATAFTVGDVVLANATIEEKTIAARAGVPITYTVATGLEAQAFYSVFQFDLENVNASLASSDPANPGTSELDETVMFETKLPTLTPADATLKERSAFALVNMSPSRKNLTEISATGITMMHQLRRRFIA